MEKAEFAPRRVSDRVVDLDITGYVFAWNEDEEGPQFLRLAGSPDLFLAVFSTVEKLRAIIKDDSVGIKTITNAWDFLESVPLRTPEGNHLRIAIDIHKTDEGTFRYSELNDQGGVIRGPAFR